MSRRRQLRSYRLTESQLSLVMPRNQECSPFKTAVVAQPIQPGGLSLPLNPYTAGTWAARINSVKNALRRYLMAAFPIGLVHFTRDNADEPLGEMIAGHRELLRLMRRPGLRPLVKACPSLVYRCYRVYLARSFTKKERRAAIKQHYAYLSARISENFYPVLLRDRPNLWQGTIGSHVFAVRLAFNEEIPQEGDLLLEFLEDLVPLYYLSFTIVPGSLVGSEAELVLLIARIQGAFGRFETIRRATKACRGFLPNLLIAAIQGISEALNVWVIAGVRNKEHLTANADDSLSRNISFDYDAFWRTHVGDEGEKFYLMSVPIPDKPLEMTSPRHRARTRQRRQLKREIAAASKEALSRMLAAGK
jgi:uncharacterized protein VirK/YbjX